MTIEARDWKSRTDGVETGLCSLREIVDGAGKAASIESTELFHEHHTKGQWIAAKRVRLVAAAFEKGRVERESMNIPPAPTLHVPPSPIRMSIESLVSTSCPNCKTTFNVKSTLLGKRADCSICRLPFDVVDSTRTLGRIVLNSGTEICFDAIYMYDSKRIAAAEEWRMEACRHLQYQSTGLGFIGGLATVVVASAVVGVIESVATNSANAKGYEMLAWYHQLMNELRYSGSFQNLSNIEHILIPNPALWMSRDLALTGVVWTMLLEERFIIIRSLDGSPLSINFSAIEQYWVSAPRTISGPSILNAKIAD
jgi:hypothetical protein